MPGLEDLYREIILDHYRTPRNRGELETPPAHMAGQGCSISQSSASMMSQAVKGKSLAEVQALVHRFKVMMSIAEDPEDGPLVEVKLGDLEALQGVVKFPVRIKCAVLSWNTLLQALQEADI
jgi:nitrogen fixation protein NifU and related proteins